MAFLIIIAFKEERVKRKGESFVLYEHTENVIISFFLFISVPTEIEAKATRASLGSLAVGQPSDFSLYENRKLHL